MLKYSATVIEDDNSTRFLIEELIEQSGRFETIASHSDPMEALKDPIVKNSDVLFLDVEMPQITGIEFANLLDSDLKVVIVTSEKKYALDAFGIDAFDFILKPMSIARLIDIAKKLDKSTKTDQKKPIFLKTKEGHVRLNLNEVMAVSAERDYVFYHTQKKRHIVRQSMAQVLGLSSDHPFIQVHRSYIVNLDHVLSFNNDTVVLEGMEVPMSRGYKDAFLSRINKIT